MNDWLEWCRNNLHREVDNAFDYGKSETRDTANDLAEAIALLKDAVNWNNIPMTTGISGARGDKIRAFLRRKEKEKENGTNKH